MKYVAVMKWKVGGGETIVEYFETLQSCLEWIKVQPLNPEFTWCVGEY